MYLFYLCLAVLSAIIPLHADETDSMKALKRLIDGNERFYQKKLSHIYQTEAQKEALLARQTPFAIVVGCSDSRIPLEIIFDQKIGDLFVVRVAGNVIGPIEHDSIEFAVANLKAALIFVLGHENCGAVSAVIEGKVKGIGAIADLIQPAVDETKELEGDHLENAVKANVINMVDQLKKSRLIKKHIEKGEIEVKGGYYSISSGKVEIIYE